MSQSWYLSSTPCERYSGFELDDFTLYAIDGFGELLNYSPEAYTVLIENISKRAIVHSIKDENDEKKLLVNLDEISCGNMVIHKNNIWLTMTLSDDNKMYEQANIKRCFSSLKWKDSLGKTIETFFAITKDTTTSVGIDDGKVMIIPKEMRYLTIQNNSDTIKIRKLQRFIFDGDRCWRITSINTLKVGIIELQLEETELSVELDNLETRIANDHLHNYSIDIANGSGANLSIGNTLQLNVVTKNNEVVASLPITYTSLDLTKANISTSGLITCISDGIVTIQATLTNDPTIFATLSLTINSVVVPTNSINISSSTNFINVTLSKTISGNVLNNGIVDGTKTIAWSLFGSDGVSATTLASITGQTGANVTIKANSVVPYRFGDVILKAVCVQDSGIVATKTLQIKSLF